MLVGPLPGVGIGYSVMTPAGVVRPILFPFCSVNQILPSAPPTIWFGPEKPVTGVPKFPVSSRVFTAPAVPSVNQTLLSGPSAIPVGPVFAWGIVFSWKKPAVVMKPILLALNSVKTRTPYADVIVYGPLLEVGTVYSVIFTPWSGTPAAKRARRVARRAAGPK